MTASTSQSSRAAAERYFRLYHRHCVVPDQDTLFALLNAVHSLNDKLSKELEVDFYSCKEFVPLQALRNLFHHKVELTHEVRIVPAAELPSISTDLMFLCLVSRDLVQQSVTQIPQKRQQVERKIIEDTLKWYGSVVNINPCIFNFSVRVYEQFRELSIELEGTEFDDFAASYEFESRSNHSHFVSGDISCLAGDINTVLAKVYGGVA